MGIYFPDAWPSSRLPQLVVEGTIGGTMSDISYHDRRHYRSGILLAYLLYLCQRDDPIDENLPFPGLMCL
jgi:hypothetical protein